MAEVGCLKDGYFQNLQVEGDMIMGKQNNSGVVYGFIKGSSNISETRDHKNKITLGTFPANCRIKNLMLIFDSDVETGAGADDKLDFTLGVEDNDDSIIEAAAIAGKDAEAQANTLSGKVLYNICSNYRMVGADLLNIASSKDGDGLTEDNPASNESFSRISTEVSTSDKVLVATITPKGSDLTSGSANCTIILEYFSSFYV